MIQKSINFTQLLKRYKSGWVGISSDFKKVLVHAKSLKLAQKKAEGLNEKVYFFPAGEVYSNFIG